MSGVVFYTIGIAFASGVFLRSFFVFGYAEVLFLLTLSFAAAVIWRMRSRNYRSPLFLIGIALLSLSIGMLRLLHEEVKLSPLMGEVGIRVTYEGVIVREPDERSTTVHLYTKLDAKDELVLVITNKYQPFRYGDRIEVSGTVSLPESFETDLGRTFNYPGYLKARGVRYTIPFAEVAIIKNGEGNPVFSLLFEGKHAFMRTVEAAITEPAAGLGEGLLLGVKRALGEDLEEAFRRAGIIHIVVLSGYNVMLVAEAIMRLLSFFFMPRTRMAIGIIGISAFALLVGLSATVVRASIMAILVLIARATGRIYAITRALLLAGVVMLMVNPYLLAFDPGFQLSFLATLGLIFLSPLLDQRFGFVPTAFQVREFITATVATQFFVLPLLLYQIGEFSIVAALANVLVLPMVPVAMGLTFLTGITGVLSSVIGVAFGFAAFVSLQYIIVLAELFSRLSFATISVPPFPFWLVILLYAGIGGILVILSRKKIDYELEIRGAKEDFSDWTILEMNEAKPTSSGVLPFR